MNPLLNPILVICNKTCVLIRKLILYFVWDTMVILAHAAHSAPKPNRFTGKCQAPVKEQWLFMLPTWYFLVTSRWIYDLPCGSVDSYGSQHQAFSLWERTWTLKAKIASDQKTAHFGVVLWYNPLLFCFFPAAAFLHSAWTTEQM